MMRTRKSGALAEARKQAHVARSNENTMRKHLAAIAKERDRLRLLCDEPMRVIAVEAIREVTGCPDIKGNGKYLVDVLMEKVRDFVTPNA